jgi:hypothetical protein
MEIWCNGTRWEEVAQDGARWRAVVNTVINNVWNINLQKRKSNSLSKAILYFLCCKTSSVITATKKYETSYWFVLNSQEGKSQMFNTQAHECESWPVRFGAVQSSMLGFCVKMSSRICDFDYKLLGVSFVSWHERKWCIIDSLPDSTHAHTHTHTPTHTNLQREATLAYPRVHPFV